MHRGQEAVLSLHSFVQMTRRVKLSWLISVCKPRVEEGGEVRGQNQVKLVEKNVNIMQSKLHAKME